MELSQTGLALLFAAALACGFFMGALYDAFAILPTLCGKVYSPRLHRRLSGIKRPPVGGQKLGKFRRAALPAALFLHDLLMALTAGVLTVLVIYRFNDGQFRASVPIGFFAGMLIYRSTLRRLMSPVTELCGFAVGYALQCVAFCLVARFDRTDQKACGDRDRSCDRAKGSQKFRKRDGKDPCRREDLRLPRPEPTKRKERESKWKKGKRTICS